MDTIRKWLNKPKADDKSLLARFYHADRSLTSVASELDSFDGRAEPERCSRLVSRLRQGQDRVLAITNQIMDELLCDDRTPRAFRAKFPEEVLQESLAGQLWFGAECLAAGSSIMNREEESSAMRPLAKAVTKSLDNVRNLLREQCLRNNIPNSPTLSLDINDSSTENLYESLKIFDRLFAEFELSYVSAMVQVKTKQEHEMQELICVLFSESLQRALKLGLLDQEQVDTYDPSLMFSIPRLAIISGLVIYDRGPLNLDFNSEQISEMFRPFKTLLLKIKDLLRTLNKTELYQLEKLLCTNEDIHLKNNNININKNKKNCDDDDDGNHNDNIDDDDKIHSDDDLVSNILGDCRTNKDILLTTNFYPIQQQSPQNTVVVNDDDDDDEDDDDDDEDDDDDTEQLHDCISNDWTNDNKDNLEDTEVTTLDLNCPSGYLIPNTNFGNLLQTNETPLTDSFISSDTDEYRQQQQTIQQTQQNIISLIDQNVAVQCTNIIGIDSGICTENTSLDRTPDAEVNLVQAGKKIRNRRDDSILSERYAENWENLQKTQPGCSKTSSDSSDDSELITIKKQTIKITNKNRMKTFKSGTSSSKRKSKRSSDSSSCDTSSCQSDGDPQEVALALRAAGRMKFKSTENLLHRLFVCIAGVADQLQTNFASDLRQILRSVFLINTSPIEEEIKINEKPKDNDMFEFRASENDVIQENSGGSNQSIYSAEEVSPEGDSVFCETREERSSSLESDNRVTIIKNHTERSRSLGENPNENVDEITSQTTESRQYNDNKRSNSVRERNNSTTNRKNRTIASESPVNYSPENSPINGRTSSHNNTNDTITQQHHQQQQHNCQTTSLTQKPPRWIPDEEAPRCMACAILFTAFRRRHHCRNCGGVFCGICSNSSAPLPRFGLIKAVRVCRDCYVREVAV